MIYDVSFVIWDTAVNGFGLDVCVSFRSLLSLDWLFLVLDMMFVISDRVVVILDSILVVEDMVFESPDMIVACLVGVW